MLAPGGRAINIWRLTTSVSLLVLTLFLQEKVQREGVSILKWQRGAKGAGFYSILGGLVS